MRNTITLERIQKYTKFLEDIKDKCDRNLKRPTMDEICTAHKVSKSIIPLLRKRGALIRKGGGRTSSWEWNENRKTEPRFVRILLKDMAKENHANYTRRVMSQMSQKIAVGTTAQSTNLMPTIGENAGMVETPKKRTKRTPSKMAKEKASGFHLSIGWGLIKIETK